MKSRFERSLNVKFEVVWMEVMADALSLCLYFENLSIL